MTDNYLPVLDSNEIGPASFFIQGIVCILHVAILHLFSTFSPQRSADQTSQEQQSDRSTSSNGVTSETAEVLDGMTQSIACDDSRPAYQSHLTNIQDMEPHLHL